MRYFLFTISGIFSALFGWGISQFVLDFLRSPIDETLPIKADFIILPFVAASLAVAIVIAEIFSSNPTRHKANFRVLPPYFWSALLTGVGAGLAAAIFNFILYQTPAPDWMVRVFAWSIVGLFTGVGEGVSWRFRSIEGGTDKAKERIKKSTLFGLGAGVVAAVIVELIRSQIELGGYEDPAGFSILGFSLGLLLSFATSPSYLAALRAGEGFEAIDPKYGGNREKPLLKNIQLRFVTGEYKYIQEGLSIQLPSKTQKRIIIGSNDDADIYIPNIPLEAASLEVRNGNVMLRCLADEAVQIQRRLLIEGGKEIPLRHNQILTFYYEKDSDKYYRFVFYNKFLDPQA
ncbi:hypothetical protein [Aerosakkonema funiforme]|uniref:Uncharacterized protein n=1 Tax=Aerosakkonema funiforme FACHB-1375 TaxID=2949571 RepID=A0A926ZHV4_9CYAN|nr:hypothetical protein [Aerosakkonema funiforme]MBD2183039.1 hypothetical protein [Aerosakkonema funiforme FACHB-1375]